MAEFGEPLISRQRLYWYWWLGQEIKKMHEKRGVVDGENLPPKDADKQAADKTCCGNPKSCGSDPASKLADAAAQAKQASDANHGLPVTKTLPPL